MVLAVILLIIATVAGSIVLSARHGSPSNLVHQLPAVAPGMIGVFVLYALLGVGVGSWLTNQVAALIATLGWFLIGETLIGVLLNALHSGLSLLAPPATLPRPWPATPVGSWAQPSYPVGRRSDAAGLRARLRPDRHDRA